MEEDILEVPFDPKLGCILFCGRFLWAVAAYHMDDKYGCLAGCKKGP